MSNDSIADQLATDITLIKGRNPGIYTLSGTNCYLIGSGASRILIDSGQGIKVMEMEFTRYLDDLKITISDLLITHRHHDHVGGIFDTVAFQLTCGLRNSIFKEIVS